MSILSIRFFIFILILAGLYYISPQKFRPYLMLCGNIVFYLSFDWRYSLFLLFSVVSTWFAALQLEKTSSKKLWLGVTAAANLGLLLFVKYAPYLLSLAHPGTEEQPLSILVPVGISFYTLQVTGYLIDVSRKKYAPERNFCKYALFASFFPLMLQGPISRYDQLAPQLSGERETGSFYDNLTQGAQLMLWGFGKKLIIAEYAAVAANTFFENYSAFNSVCTFAAVFCYTIQIYTDFSGCVDICRGAGLVFGIRIIDNFRHPYFACSIQDFWRRWHIALSSWFRDYLYIPLGGNRKGIVRKYLNIILVFLVSGIWHGVGLHFLFWGLLHGVYQVIGALTLPAKKRLCAALHIDRDRLWFRGLQMLITFILINITWIFFRASTIREGFAVIGHAFTAWDGTLSLTALGLMLREWAVLLLSILVLLTVSTMQNRGIVLQQAIAAKPLPVRWAIYLLGFLLVLVFGIYGPGYSGNSFIYMNF